MLLQARLGALGVVSVPLQTTAKKRMVDQGEPDKVADAHASLFAFTVLTSSIAGLVKFES